MPSIMSLRGELSTNARATVEKMAVSCLGASTYRSLEHRTPTRGRQPGDSRVNKRGARSEAAGGVGETWFRVNLQTRK